jgi:hypothetical protein
LPLDDRYFDLASALAMLATSAVRRFGMSTAAMLTASTAAAVVRMLEHCRLLRMLMLEGLHLLRVLTL